jgi:nucleotide-binding universal stress UspA family protein
MLKILLAVDGSESAQRATRELIKNAGWYKETPWIELLTVRAQLPVGGLSGMVVNREMVERYYREEGEKALAPSEELLRQAGVPFTSHVVVGDVAQTICQQAKTLGCAMIYMGTRGMAPISSLVLGSVSTKVLHLTHVPVVLIP